MHPLVRLLHLPEEPMEINLDHTPGVPLIEQDLNGPYPFNDPGWPIHQTRHGR
jgi:hypothetical protein